VDIKEQNHLIHEIDEKLKTIAIHMEKMQIADYVQLLNRPRKLILLNLVGGIARGVGIAIGFTIFTTLIVYILQGLGALNLPIIGDFIADLVKHVQVRLNY
jgi:tetrahydromethanopterin S-methyltransferase subunit F